MGSLTLARLSLVLLAATLLRPLTASAEPQIDSQYGPLPVFELHSGFWINLHHTLYQEARQREATPSGRTKGGKTTKPVLQTTPGARTALTSAEQRAWEEAVSYYTANYADRDLAFSTELVLLKNQLGDFETCDELSGAKKKRCDAGLPSKLTQVLEAAAPILSRAPVARP